MYCNSQNCRYYAQHITDVPTSWHNRREQSTEHLTVWAVLRHGRELFWYIYAQNTHVDTDAYIRRSLAPFFGKRGPFHRQTDIFMQDGATFLFRKKLKTLTFNYKILVIMSHVSHIQ